jgi:hypothetical protein
MKKLTGTALLAALLCSPGSIFRTAFALVAFAGSVAMVGLAIGQGPNAVTSQTPVAEKSSDVQHDLSPPLSELVGKVQTVPSAQQEANPPNGLVPTTTRTIANPVPLNAASCSLGVVQNY